MQNVDIVKKAYGPLTAATYPATGPGREGYEYYAKALAESCAGPQPKRILELGCGTGRYLHCLTNIARFVGIDVSPDMLAVARRACQALPNLAEHECTLIEGDFTTFAFPPESFDFIYSIGVIGEYVPADQQMVQSIVRWLAPGGRSFFTVVDREEFARRRPTKRLAWRTALMRRLATSQWARFLQGRLAERILKYYDYSELYRTYAEMEAMLLALPIPSQYAITRMTDAKHPKLACMIFRIEAPA